MKSLSTIIKESFKKNKETENLIDLFYSDLKEIIFIIKEANLDVKTPSTNNEPIPEKHCYIYESDYNRIFENIKDNKLFLKCFDRKVSLNARRNKRRDLKSEIQTETIFNFFKKELKNRSRNCNVNYSKVKEFRFHRRLIKVLKELNLIERINSVDQINTTTAKHVIDIIKENEEFYNLMEP